MADRDSIPLLWRNSLADTADRPFLRIPTNEQARTLSYNVSAFFKRAARVAVALRKLLKLAAGSRVAVFSHDLNEFALGIHGVLLAEMTACIAEPANDELLASLFRRQGVKAVVFPPSSSARIARLIPKLPEVKHWIVSGKGASSSSLGVVERLETLLTAASGEEDAVFNWGEKSKGPAVIFQENMWSEDVLSLSSSQLIGTAKRFCDSFDGIVSDELGGLFWSAFSPGEFHGAFQSLFSPFFSRLPVVIRELDDSRDFWRQVLADGVQIAAIHDELLYSLVARGKTRDWVRSDKLRVVVYSKARACIDLFREFEKKFLVPVSLVYSRPELGGPITFAGPRKGDRPGWESKKEVPSHGDIIDSVSVYIKDSQGEVLAPEEIGNVFVQGDQFPSCERLARSKSNVPENSVNLSQLGFVDLGSGGAERLFILGDAERILRKGERTIFLEKIEQALLQMKGVVLCRAHVFPNAHTGKELGVYVIPHRLANLNRFDVEMFLAENLAEGEIPRVCVLGEPSSGTLPEDDQISLAFEEYYSYDYR
ncbi:MAG: acyl--CoA ligase [Bdellovibrionales bacterium]|nr:acyl--CoA ligase [Bdellovibrionales bacterium]